MDKENSNYNSPQRKDKKLAFWISIVLRFLAAGTSVASGWVMFTNHQTASVFGVSVLAKYSYVSSFKFLAYANVVAGGLALLTLVVTLVVSRKRMSPNGYFLLFLHDLVVMTVVVAGSSAATAEGNLGRHGNAHAGWMSICGYFGGFCHKVSVSVLLSYLTFLLFLSLALISASSSRTS